MICEVCKTVVGCTDVAPGVGYWHCPVCDYTIAAYNCPHILAEFTALSDFQKAQFKVFVDAQVS